MSNRVVAVGFSSALIAGLLTGALASPALASCGGGGYSGGDGTAGDPYQIATKDDLDDLQSTDGDWDCDFVLTSDIDMGGDTWNSGIGTDSGIDAYRGTFDGRGFAVRNLTISGGGSDYMGLFGYTDSADIKNVGFTGNVSGDDEIGGLIGQADDTDVTNSWASGVVSGLDDYVGGLIGEAVNSRVTGSWATGAVSGDENIGGLVGQADSDVEISNSRASGSVTSRNEDAGGLVGDHRGKIYRSFALGSVEGVAYVGGLVGVNNNADALIEDSYARGQVVGTGQYVGGLVGDNENEIRRSYSTGSVTGGSDFGGLVGFVDVGASVSDSYWDTQTSGQSTSAGGAGVMGKTSAQMRTISTFSSWSIVAGYSSSSTWGICGAVNSGYPYLTAFYSSNPCGGGSLPSNSYSLILEPAEGSICTVASVSGPVNTWVYLPPATSCRPIDENSSAVLLGWSTVRDFPVEIAQRQVDLDMGAHELTDDSGAITGVFIPSGKGALIISPNRLYAVWSEPLVVEEVETSEVSPSPGAVLA